MDKIERISRNLVASNGVCSRDVSEHDFNLLPDILYTAFPMEHLDSIRKNGYGASTMAAGGAVGFFVSTSDTVAYDYAEGLHDESDKILLFGIDKDSIGHGRMYYDANDYDTATYIHMLDDSFIGDYDSDRVEEMEEEYPDKMERLESYIESYPMCFFVKGAIPFDDLIECE